MPRYGADYQAKLKDLGYFSDEVRDYDWATSQPYYPPAQVLLAAKILTIAGASILGLGTIAVALAAWGIISL